MATPEYDKANTRRINLKLNNKTDADIIAILEAQENIQGYIKTLIRADNSSTGSKPFRTAPGKYSCGICGSELPGKQRYCGNCGQPVHWTK